MSKNVPRFVGVAIAVGVAAFSLTGCSFNMGDNATTTERPTPSKSPIVSPSSSPSVPLSKSTSNSSYRSNSSSTSFTNKYGTSTTRCAHSGCNNYIASSGDTNCCTTHSNRCLECKKYIDEDAVYCVSCIEKAVKAVGKTKK